MRKSQSEKMFDILGRTRTETSPRTLKNNPFGKKRKKNRCYANTQILSSIPLFLKERVICLLNMAVNGTICWTSTSRVSVVFLRGQMNIELSKCHKTCFFHQLLTVDTRPQILFCFLCLENRHRKPFSSLFVNESISKDKPLSWLSLPH